MLYAVWHATSLSYLALCFLSFYPFSFLLLTNHHVLSMRFLKPCNLDIFCFYEPELCWTLSNVKRGKNMGVRKGSLM